ncbi:hypothetical protein C1645_739973 [Glomus cerebriforme]|uniref:Uncharacterized protein n=1 Tax=Glomus cerebriforme TaxID=658196 RepID=A0A397SXK2_9GLOM|nr:hypothetical protein C1645_739973 [Glomus cerebriforme]
MGTTKSCLVVQHERWPAWSDSLMSFGQNGCWLMNKLDKFVLDARFCRPHTGINKFFSNTSLRWWSDIEKFTRLIYASDPTVTAQQVFSQYVQSLIDIATIKNIDPAKEEKNYYDQTNFHGAKSNDVENRRTAVYGDSYDLNDEINNFFQSSSERPSPNLFSKRDHCSKCHMEINISGSMRFCPYCGSKVASSNVIEFEEFESDDEEPVESDHEADENKDDEDPPKINKLAFREAHHAIPDNAKMHLKSGKIVEDVLFDFAKDMEHEQTDAPSLASANRKTRGRSGNTKTRKLTGRKIDGIVYIVDRNLEVGAIEAARSFLGVSDRKYLLEMFKMPKTLRDMYADLVRTANYDEQKANNLQVFGILHLGLWIQFTRLYRAGGSICIFRKDVVSHHVDSKFSEDGIKSFLKLMAAVYQHKLIIRDNLRTLNIRNANIESGEDDNLLNDIEIIILRHNHRLNISPILGPPQERKRDQKVRIRRKRLQ